MPWWRLIARDRLIGARLRVLQQQATPIRVSSAVVGQVWRDGRTQANLARGAGRRRHRGTGQGRRQAHRRTTRAVRLRRHRRRARSADDSARRSRLDQRSRRHPQATASPQGYGPGPDRVKAPGTLRISASSGGSLVKAVCVVGGSQSVARRSPLLPAVARRSTRAASRSLRGRPAGLLRGQEPRRSRPGSRSRSAPVRRVPSAFAVLGFADEVRSADAPVVEAAVDGEREVVVDPAALEEVGDRVVDVCKHAAAGTVQDGQILRMSSLSPSDTWLCYVWLDSSYCSHCVSHLQGIGFVLLLAVAL